MKILQNKGDHDFDILQRFSQKFIVYKYSYLGISIILLFILLPFLEKYKISIIPFLFYLTMLAVLSTLNLSKNFFRFCLALGTISFLFTLLSKNLGLTPGESFYCYLIGLSGTTLFFFLIISAFMLNIFSEKKVTTDTIKGGVSVYFLLGILWTFLYAILLLVDSDAISLPKYTGTFSELLYFSFTTLTTLGYGDITPLSWATRNLTILESAIGQIYLTVLIARLVGLHLAAKND